MKKELIAHEDPKSHVSELFRTIENQYTIYEFK